MKARKPRFSGKLGLYLPSKHAKFQRDRRKWRRSTNPTRSDSSGNRICGPRVEKELISFSLCDESLFDRSQKLKENVSLVCPINCIRVRRYSKNLYASGQISVWKVNKVLVARKKNQNLLVSQEQCFSYPSEPYTVRVKAQPAPTRDFF